MAVSYKFLKTKLNSEDTVIISDGTKEAYEYRDANTEVGSCYQLYEAASLKPGNGIGDDSRSITIDEDHILVAESDVLDDYYVGVYEINEDFDTITPVGTPVRISQHRMMGPSFCQMDDEHFVLAFMKNINPGGNRQSQDCITVLGIDLDTWEVTITTEKTYWHDGAHHSSFYKPGQWNCIRKINDTKYVIAYDVGVYSAGPYVSTGYITTFDVSSYVFTPIQQQQMSPQSGQSLAVLSESLLVVTGSANNYAYLQIQTFTIDGSFNLSAVDYYSLYHGSTENTSVIAFNPTTIMVSSFHWGNPTKLGCVRIYNFDPDGDNIAWVVSLTHELVTFVDPTNSLIKQDDTHVGLAYTGDGGVGRIKVFETNSSYTSITEVFSLEHDADLCRNDCLTYLGNCRWFLSFYGTDTNETELKIFGSTLNDVTFSVESQYFDVTRPGKQFIMTAVVVDAVSIGEFAEYIIVVISDMVEIATIVGVIDANEDSVQKHLTGNLPVTGFRYTMRGTAVQINNIRVVGHYIEE